MGAYKLTEKAIGSTPTENTYFVVTQPETVNNETVEAVRRLTAAQIADLLVGGLVEDLGGLKIFKSTITASVLSQKSKTYALSDNFRGLVIAIGGTGNSAVVMLNQVSGRAVVTPVYRGSGISLTVPTNDTFKVVNVSGQEYAIYLNILVFNGTIEEAS